VRFDEFKKQVFQHALALGCESAELFMRDCEDTTVEVLDQAVASHSYSHTVGAALRVKFEGKDGYFYTESFLDPRQAAQKALDNARYASADEHPMNDSCDALYSLDCGDDTAEKVSTGDMIDIALDTEKYALDADERIKRVSDNIVAKVQQTTVITNTLGLEGAYTSSLLMSCISPVAEMGEDKKSGYTFAVGADVRSPKATALRGVQLTLAKFGAQSIPGGDYKLIIMGKTMANILATFSEQFCADNAQKGMSPLQNREGEIIAASCVNLTDDPFYKVLPRPFDDEGSLSQVTPLVREGKLLTLLHNLKTAKKAGCKTTANASRPSLSSPIGVGCTNLVLEEGDSSLEQLMLTMGDGLLINSVSGLHAGANPVTGDFSLLASGFEVKGGKIARPIEGITIAGDFLKLLQNVELVGNDTQHTEPSGSVFASPSVYIRQGIKVSGE
jgi:PmbA protein